MTRHPARTHQHPATVPVRAVAARLPKGRDEVQVFQRLASTSLAQWQANRAGLAGPQADVEYVHQARVALRRLRSAMDLFGHVLPRAWLRRWKPFWRTQARSLGVARDWDVLVNDWLPRVSAVADLAPTLSAWSQTHREAAHAELLAQVNQAGIDRQLKAFCRSVDRLPPGTKPVRVRPRWVRQRVRRLHEQAVRACRAVVDADEESRHALRIRLKRLRYTVDFLAQWMPPKRVRRYQRALAAVLDHLGQLNDLATVRRLLSGAPVEVQSSLDDWLCHQESTLLIRLPMALQAWQRTVLPWKRRH